MPPRIAIKFTPDGGSIHLGCVRETGNAMIWIADDGPGIPADERELVFDRFYRSTSTSDEPGSGLGLPIARAMANALGGTLHVGPSATGTPEWNSASPHPPADLRSATAL